MHNGRRQQRSNKHQTSTSLLSYILVLISTKLAQHQIFSFDTVVHHTMTTRSFKSKYCSIRYNNNHCHRHRHPRCRQRTLLLSTMNHESNEMRHLNGQSLYNQRYELLQSSSKLSLAPMMEYTDRHFRHLIRCITSQTLLYTEMVSTNAICHEQRLTIQEQQNQHYVAGVTPINYKDSYLLRYLQQGRVEPVEGASVLQLGGSDPQQMYEAAQTILELTQQGYCNYTAINLNCGCPSPKVAGKGCFGAALMHEPQLVSQLTQALYEGCSGTMPVTVKCRIGTDSKEEPFRTSTYGLNAEEEYNKLCNFVETVASNHIVTDFAVHARIAVINRSFSPADNRKIPPLQYNVVRQLVRDYPHLHFTLNGGINTLSQVQSELLEQQQESVNSKLQGIMVGRAFAADPWSFAMADQLVYGIAPNAETQKNRLQILQQYGHHADEEEERAGTIDDVQNIRRFIVKAVTPLFAGEMNAKKYRIALDEISKIPKQLKVQGKTTMSGQSLISELIINAAMEHLSEETLLRTPEESYERVLHEERKQQPRDDDDGITVLSIGRSSSIDEWQELRKADNIEYLGSYDNVLSSGI